MPQPNPAVVALLERLVVAARSGEVQACAVAYVAFDDKDRVAMLADYAAAAFVTPHMAAAIPMLQAKVVGELFLGPRPGETRN